MYRYELKFAIDLLEAEAITANILCHPASFSKAFPDRQINNIYLDTLDFDCFHQNVEGHPSRSKMRLRWYGQSDTPTQKSTLEIKHKQAELGWKENFPMDANGIDSKADLMEAVQATRPSMSLLAPTLHNSYQRAYYLSSDEKFRVTIDTEQQFRMPFQRNQPLEMSTYPVILELKYAAEDAEFAREITDYFKFRQTKNSKYVTGIEALYL
ncbi:MAG: VTC domain-containing protein [Saprospiraceae bacterium]